MLKYIILHIILYDAKSEIIYEDAEYYYKEGGGNKL